MIVYLGRQSQEGPNPNEVNRTVTQFIVHPSIVHQTLPYDNDIALLKLSSPVTFTPYIRPVCLAAADSTFHTGTVSWVTGWGTTEPGGEKVLGDRGCGNIVFILSTKTDKK